MVDGGADWAVAVFPALLSTKEFPEELLVEGQGRRKVLKVLELSFGNFLAGTFSFPQYEQAVFQRHKHTQDFSPEVPS